MGDLIHLRQHRTAPSRLSTPAVPVFFFDVSCPLSYLTSEGIERRLGEVAWVAVNSAAVRPPGARRSPALRTRADAAARALRLPLVWPERFPASTPRALRASAFACEIGAGASFALAASRLAFCGGFDLEDPETLAEAAAAGGVPLEACLAAAGETWRDGELQATATMLRDHAVTEVPAIRLGDRWVSGEWGVPAARALSCQRRSAHRSLAPAG